MRVNVRKIGIAYLIVILISIGVIVKIVDLQFFNKPGRQGVKAVEKTEVLDCTRGSILASDGRYLAFSIPEYRLCMDPCQATDTLFNSGIDQLSKDLAAFFKDKRASEYKKVIVEARKKGRLYVRLNRRLLTYQEMQEVSTFPILKEGQRRGGARFEKVDHRSYPYGRLGFRTLGYIKDQYQIPTIGLEGSCDSLLRGKEGSQHIRLTEGNKWIPNLEKPTIPPVDGMDVQITIDIDMQDIAQTALMNILKKTTELHAGTVVLMEVATGEIKAMVNLEKTGKGGFDETYNYAIGRKGEPGSVFKAATLTTLIEEGLVTLDTEVPATVNWPYAGRIFTDHYLDKYHGNISIRRGFEISSNNVFRMLAAKYYGNKPDVFIGKIRDERKITMDFPFELKGFSSANLKTTKNKSWNASDLPQIAMGYTVEITPLHTLNFYNAIANGGVMVRPHLVRNYQKDGVIIKETGTEKLGVICKPETAAKMREVMRCVVEAEGGTGHNVFKGCPVAVAGKTGTARIVFPGTGRYNDYLNRKMHQATFIGFFPYEAPKYSMIVVVYSEPTTQNFYGATWSGPVFREVAEKIYSSSTDWSPVIRPSSPLPETTDFRYLDDLNGGTPDVVGMGLRDALARMEKLGYTVTFTGTGRVLEQRITDSLEKKVTLKLGNDENIRHNKEN